MKLPHKGLNKTLQSRDKPNRDDQEKKKERKRERERLTGAIIVLCASPRVVREEILLGALLAAENTRRTRTAILTFVKSVESTWNPSKTNPFGVFPEAGDDSRAPKRWGEQPQAGWEMNYKETFYRWEVLQLYFARTRGYETEWHVPEFSSCHACISRVYSCERSPIRQTVRSRVPANCSRRRETIQGTCRPHFKLFSIDSEFVTNRAGKNERDSFVEAFVFEIVRISWNC